MSYEFYELSDSKEKRLPLKLLYITKSKYDKGWHSTQHSHHFTELFYIISGKGYFLLPGKEIPVKGNDLVIINPNVQHTEKSNAGDSLEYIALGITGITFKLENDEEKGLGLYTYQGDQSTILFLLHMLLDEVQQGLRNYESICQNLLEMIVARLERQKFSIKKATKKDGNDTASFMKHYMNHHFREQITLDSLADAAHLNKFYLSHIFKKNTGISPIDYLNQVRIKEAKSLLKNTNYPIAEIATINGFSSQSFFSQAFKRATNMTPSRYRKEMKRETLEI